MGRFKDSLRSVNPTALVLELVIVFSGVYLAFLLSNYQESRKLDREAERVIGLLEVGMDRYEELFGGFVLYHKNHNAAFRAKLEQNEIPDFGDTYYHAPQYPIDVIKFLLTRESYEIFTVDAYVPLTAFANAMERLTYIEAKLVATSEQYEPLPPSGTPGYDEAFIRQKRLAIRYLDYLNFRMNVSQELVDKAQELRGLFNELNPGGD